jgi:hypothetical protein
VTPGEPGISLQPASCSSHGREGACTECCSPPVAGHPRKARRSLSPFSLPDRRRRLLALPPATCWRFATPKVVSSISFSARSRSAASSSARTKHHSRIGARLAAPMRQQRRVVLRPGEIVIAAAARVRLLSPRAGPLPAARRGLLQVLRAGRAVAKAPHVDLGQDAG